MAILKYLPNIIRTLRREKIIRNFFSGELFPRERYKYGGETHACTFWSCESYLRLPAIQPEHTESTETTQSSQNSTSNDIDKWNGSDVTKREF
jgi:hypothetical protein